MMHHTLVYDICDLFANTFTEASTEMLLRVLQHCGFQLRKDDPARLLKLITTIKAKTQVLLKRFSDITLLFVVMAANQTKVNQ